MSTTQDKIDAYVRREKLKKFLIFAAPVVIAVILAGYTFYNNSQSTWSNREVTGVMVSSRPVELKTGGFHQVEVILENNKTALVRIERISEFRKGRKVLLNKSVNLDSGRVKYRFLRGIE